jgi:hypothetical protein
MHSIDARGRRSSCAGRCPCSSSPPPSPAAPTFPRSNFAIAGVKEAPIADVDRVDALSTKNLRHGGGEVLIE